MSGDDRQNSPSISRQNRPSATAIPISEVKLYHFFFCVTRMDVKKSKALDYQKQRMNNLLRHSQNKKEWERQHRITASDVGAPILLNER